MGNRRFPAGLARREFQAGCLALKSPTIRIWVFGVKRPRSSGGGKDTLWGFVKRYDVEGFGVHGYYYAGVFKG